MFSPSPRLFKAAPSSVKRLPLSTKQAANKGGYYKGTRVGSMGWHTTHGRYVIDLRKVRTYVAPEDEKGEGWTQGIHAELKPFISKVVQPPKPTKESKDYSLSAKIKTAPVNGESLLKQWKEMHNDAAQNASPLEDASREATIQAVAQNAQLKP